MPTRVERSRRRRRGRGALVGVLTLSLAAAGFSASAIVGGRPVPSASSHAPQGDQYLVGAGIYDVTGAVAETGAFGYASQQEIKGLQQRLYARAYVIGDPRTGKRVVYVCADAGAIFQQVKLNVVKKLQEQFGDTYTDDNVLLTATHTHVGNAGMSTYTLYQAAGNDKSLHGYDQRNLDTMTDGIVAAIKRADHNLRPGRLAVVTGDLPGATRNRSLPAYATNRDARDFHGSVDSQMTVLKLTADDGKPVGMISWFATHPTSFPIHWRYLSGDNKGYAEYRFEQMMGSDPRRADTFVAAFANGTEGDVVSSDGNSESAPGYEGDPNDFVNAERAGNRQFYKAVQLWRQAGTPVTGPIDVRSRWADFKRYTVKAEFTGGEGEKQLCMPARGFSFAPGGENGPSKIPGVYEGMTVGSFDEQSSISKINGQPGGGLVVAGMRFLSLGWQDPCQAEKPVLLPTGRWSWVPTVLPMQLVRIGDLAIVSIPGEPTTMSGRRLREVVAQRLQDQGVDQILVEGLANTYSGYLATREEYRAQNYEGASTEFGPDELAAFEQEYAGLATAMRDGTEVEDDTQPEDRGDRRYAERPGVLFDDKPGDQEFGTVLEQPEASYHAGQTASAVFRAGHPKNSYRTMDTFLKVERWDGKAWVEHLTDRDWDTTYTWEREGISFSRATVEWRIRRGTPAGRYRLVQTGDWKNGWTGQIAPYTGVSDPFEVV